VEISVDPNVLTGSGRKWRPKRTEAPRLLAEARTRKGAEVSRRHHRQMGDRRRHILRTYLPAVAVQAPQHLFLTAAVSVTSPSTTSTAGAIAVHVPVAIVTVFSKAAIATEAVVSTGRQARLPRVALRDSARRACPVPTP